MPVYLCPYPDCTSKTAYVSDVLAAELFAVHKLTHAVPIAPAPAAQVRQKAPKIDRPKVSFWSSEEEWNAFSTQWGMFKHGTDLTPDETV